MTDATVTPAKRPRKPRASNVDVEAKSIASISIALKELPDDAARVRVLKYASNRYNLEM